MAILRASLAFTRLASRRSLLEKAILRISRICVYPASGVIGDNDGRCRRNAPRPRDRACSTSCRRVFRSRNNFASTRGDISFTSLIAWIRWIRSPSRVQSNEQHRGNTFLASVLRGATFSPPARETVFLNARQRRALHAGGPGASRREERRETTVSARIRGATARQGRLAIARTNALPREGAKSAKVETSNANHPSPPAPPPSPWRPAFVT